MSNSKQINLLNHQGLSFEGFKAWLNQFIADKKGALPDLNDWKVIKEKLDSVKVTATLTSPGCSVVVNDINEYHPIDIYDRFLQIVKEVDEEMAQLGIEMNRTYSLRVSDDDECQGNWITITDEDLPPPDWTIDEITWFDEQPTQITIKYDTKLLEEINEEEENNGYSEYCESI